MSFSPLGLNAPICQAVAAAGYTAPTPVHPPLGKWLIALGIRIFGMNPVGWRIGAAVAGRPERRLLSRRKTL